MKVYLLVEMEVAPSDSERWLAAGAYYPTEEAPTPDEEWIADEVAMTRVQEHVDGFVAVSVVGEPEESADGAIVVTTAH